MRKFTGKFRRGQRVSYCFRQPYDPDTRISGRGKITGTETVEGARMYVIADDLLLYESEIRKVLK